MPLARFPSTAAAGILLAFSLAASAQPAGPAAAPGAVSALGRLEPEHGLIRVGSPSTPEAISGSVVARLLVEEGDDVSVGQLLAVTDAAPVVQAKIGEARAEIDLAVMEAEAAQSRANEACVRADVAARESARRDQLLQKGLAGEEEAENARGEAEATAASCTAAQTAVRAARAGIDVSRAKLVRFEAEFERAHIRAPAAGRVLEILVRPGEFVGMEGIVEMGAVDRMYAIAEVYETDIRRVQIGQGASVSSPALEAPLSGTVKFIRPKVQKMDEIGTDPAARKDARIVEVGILLDHPDPVMNLTHLQVEVVIRP